MTGKLLLGFTFIVYITLALFNLQKVNASGERLMGWGMMAFGIVAVYVLCSLLLTIKVASSGGFHWISQTAATRNIAVGILWLGMVAGVAFCTMLRMEWNTDPTTGIVRSLIMPVYFGAVWLPLLMLVPYTILLNSGWRDSLSPVLFKLPLLVSCALGFLILMAPKLVIALGITVPQKETVSPDQIFNNFVKSIDSQTSIDDLLKYAGDQDERVRMAARDKIKARPDWENELISRLERNDEYGHLYFHGVYVFLDDNRVEHPDRFIEPVNTSIATITTEAQRVLKKSFLYTGDLSILNIDGVCRVLDEQFKDSSNVLRPNMLKLEEALEAPPLEKPDTDRDFVDMRNRYRMAVENWLASN